MNQSTNDRRVRQALGDLLDTAPPAPLSPRDLVPFAPADGRRHAMPVLVGVMAVAAVAAGGIVLASRPDDPPSAGSATVPATTAPVVDTAVTTPASSVPAPPVSLPGGAFDRLPVAAGASDFYAGPESLGEPQVNTGLFASVVRCAELTADGTACARLEGIAGVELVSYEPGADVTIDTVARNVGSYAVRVGTTFTEVTPEAYAGQWSSAPFAAGDTTTVRGHAAVRFEHEGSPAVVWQERPGVLVWVVVPPEQEDELLTVAEGVRPVDGPATIPELVVVTPLSTIWDAGNNNADGVIVARAGGVECVGLEYIDGTCGDSIEQRTVVRHRSDGTTAIVGSTPAGVASVRVSTSDGASATQDTVAFAPYASRFYATSVTSATTITVTWLDAGGATVGEASFTPARPDVGVDTTVPRDVASAMLEQLKYRVDLAFSQLDSLGFSNHRSSTGPGGVTTISATDASGARVITITMTPGAPVVPENHDRAPITTTPPTANRVGMDYASNSGWHFTLVADTSGTVPLPKGDELTSLLFFIDP